MVYWDDSFVSPMSGAINGTTYAADNFKCPYTIPQEWPLCNGSASESIYMDPNVPMDEYDLCDETWIEDGMYVVGTLHSSLIFSRALFFISVCLSFSFALSLSLSLSIPSIQVFATILAVSATAIMMVKIAQPVQSVTMTQCVASSMTCGRCLEPLSE